MNGMRRRTASFLTTTLVAAGALLVLAAFRGPSSETITVPAGGDLQRALQAARPGDTILLQPEATYVGNFFLPARVGSDTRPITVRTATPNGDPVPTGQRLTPTQAGRLARLRSPDTMPALRTEPRARYWRIELVEFLANRGGEGDVIALGDGSAAQKILDEVPSDLVLDRVYIHGDPRAGQKRGVALNSARTTISNSYIADIKAVGQEAQAIAGWNGPGEYLIENNYLEGAGENVIFGGSDPSIAGLTPTQIVIRGNVLAKRLEWRDAGPRWTVKNLLELKNARRVTISGNLLEYNWPQAQTGCAVLFTVRNQDGQCPWCAVQDVVFQDNIVRHASAFLNILGVDANPSQRTANVKVLNNLVTDLSPVTWNNPSSGERGSDRVVLITSGPRDVEIGHNTILGTHLGSFLAIGSVGDTFKTEGLNIHDNVLPEGEYGLTGEATTLGRPSLDAFAPGAVLARNVIVKGTSGRSIDYGPQRNAVVDSSLMVVNPQTFAVIGSYPTTDGKSVGADLGRLPRQTEVR
jgi:hypothetical protein